MDILKLLQDCVKSLNIDINVIKDTMFAICVADNLNGTNQRELDIDKLVESDTELNWDGVLTYLNITPQHRGCTKLPRVQKLRVISDCLSLILENDIDGLILTCITSKKVKDNSLSYIPYADENECIKNLEKIQSHISVSTDFGYFEDLYKKLVLYSRHITQLGGFDLPDGVERIVIPESIYDGVGTKKTLTEFYSYLSSLDKTLDDYCSYILDIYCYEVVQEVARLMNKRFIKNEVEFNLIITRLNNFAINYLPIGTFSLNGYTQRLSVLRNVPSYLSRKVNIVFSDSSFFSEMTIHGCIAVLKLLRKTSIKKDDFISEMEVILNECK